ncbi:hypothetical protein EV182_003636, partial [Spiromyces aspiralis]
MGKRRRNTHNADAGKQESAAAAVRPTKREKSDPVAKNIIHRENETEEQVSSSYEESSGDDSDEYESDEHGGDMQLESPMDGDGSGPPQASVRNDSGHRLRVHDDLYRPPTADEMMALKETSQLYRSNLFRMQMEELLKETRLEPGSKLTKPLDNTLAKIRQVLLEAKPIKSHPIHAAVQDLSKRARKMLGKGFAKKFK